MRTLLAVEWEFMLSFISAYLALQELDVVV